MLLVKVVPCRASSLRVFGIAHIERKSWSSVMTVTTLGGPGAPQRDAEAAGAGVAASAVIMAAMAHLPFIASDANSLLALSQ
jgi:hypothetical protein